eukprot:356623-Chlamydomonas_euryale.AAC.1
MPAGGSLAPVGTIHGVPVGFDLNSNETELRRFGCRHAASHRLRAPQDLNARACPAARRRSRTPPKNLRAPRAQCPRMPCRAPTSQLIPAENLVALLQQQPASAQLLPVVASAAEAGAMLAALEAGTAGVVLRTGSGSEVCRWKGGRKAMAREGLMWICHGQDTAAFMLGRLIWSESGAVLVVKLTLSAMMRPPALALSNRQQPAAVFVIHISSQLDAPANDQAKVACQKDQKTTKKSCAPRQVRTLCASVASAAAAGDEDRLPLSTAKVTGLTPLPGTGDRVCVDLACLMTPGGEVGLVLGPSPGDSLARSCDAPVVKYGFCQGLVMSRDE